MIGQSLGHYRVIRQLGAGTYFVGYEAQDIVSGERVGLQLLHFDVSSREINFIDGFIQAQKALADKVGRHPNINSPFDYGVENGRLFFVVPFLGRSLTSLDRRIYETGPFEYYEINRVLGQIASALDQIHQKGILNREVYAHSILIDIHGDAVLSDWGRAALFDTALENAIPGMLGYASPEEYSRNRRNQPLSPQSDIYQLGIVLYFMTTKHHPFVSHDQSVMALKQLEDSFPPPSSFRPDLPEAAEGVIMKALAYDPNLRFRSAGEMASAFARGTQNLGPSNSSRRDNRGENSIIDSTTPTSRILFLAADPTDASRLRLGQEFREISNSLKLAQFRDRFKLELPQLSVRPADVSQALLDVQPQIVHFSCHGTSSGSLCFEDQSGKIHPVQPEALAALFEHFAPQVICVLLNACYSETQAKAIAAHIEYVIGINEAISDKSAIAFAIGFYQALGAGRTIEDAYRFGCVQIRLQGNLEHLSPTLMKNGQVQP